MKKSVRFPRACKRDSPLPPAPCSFTVPKRNAKNIRKNRKAAMASVLKDGSNNASIYKKQQQAGAESTPAVNSAMLTCTVAMTDIEVSTVNTAVTATNNNSLPAINISPPTSSHAVCSTTMVHTEPLAAHPSCRSMLSTKGINGIAYPLKLRVRDFGVQTEARITDEDIMFLKTLQAKRMNISQINAIVRNNQHIVSYIEPEDINHLDYLRMQNGELPNGLAVWERNQKHLEALALMMSMPTPNHPDGAAEEAHPQRNLSPISEDEE